MAFKFPFTNYHELNLTWVLDQLKALFEQSEENVTTIETYENRLTAVETEIPGISETASEASRAAAAAGSLAETAKTTADTAQNNAIQAQGLAGTARQEAQAAQTAANEATQAAQQAQATAQNFDGRITQAENDASQALEASRSFENRVQSAITTANNASQTATNAQGIAMRADQNAGAALDKIGDLSDLTTEAKQNLVAAINEAAASGGGGGGGTTNYNSLTNKPQINGHTLSGNKTAAQLGLATPSDIPEVPVQSVNGKTGAVVLSASDIGDDSSNVADKLSALDIEKADKTNYQNVSGSTLTLAPAVDNTIYLCGTLTELSVTAPTTGLFGIMFTSGTTPTVVNFNNSITMPSDWPSTLDASTIYEINVLNGFGVWQSWT